MLPLFRPLSSLPVLALALSLFSHPLAGLHGQTFQRSLDAFDTLALPGGGKAKTPAEWESRRKVILEGMQAIMGKLPGNEKRVPLDVRVEEEVDCGTYVRRLISYISEPGSRTPAYLCIPKSALSGKPAPGVLCLHPTENTIGHKVVVGLGGKENRQYASELASRGFVTISPSYPLLANYQPEIKALGWESGTLKAVWDNIRALDLLDSLSFVKHGKYAAIGHSLGGHNSVYTAVFDSRIQVIVSSCGLDSYRDYYGGDPTKWVLEKGWCQTRYMPRLANYQNKLAEIPFDFPELLAALAPRHVLINAPLKDSNFKWESVDRVVESARRVYALHGTAHHLTVEHPDCDHDFPDAVREKAYALIMQKLASGIVDANVELRFEKEILLQVEPPCVLSAEGSKLTVYPQKLTVTEFLKYVDWEMGVPGYLKGIKGDATGYNFDLTQKVTFKRPMLIKVIRTTMNKTTQGAIVVGRGSKFPERVDAK
jgi:dienelactone hydrolase